MDELIEFVNKEDAPKYDLLKVALAHHRFAWVHPFRNVNGRVVRLFTYALLIKYGFNVAAGGRVLNPTAIFCNDRELYYAKLSNADQGNDESLEEWALYVLQGVRDELIKVDQLARYETLKNRILLPAIQMSKAREVLDSEEEKLLRMAINKGTFKASDIDEVLPSLTPRQRTYRLTKLIERKLVAPIQHGTRTYTINFANSVLIRSVMAALVAEGFVPNLG